MKSELVRNACRSQGTVFVDIAAVSGDLTCSAGSENRFTNAGVNWHPGDKGMQGYANAIWNAIRESPAMPPAQEENGPHVDMTTRTTAPTGSMGSIFEDNFDGNSAAWQPAPLTVEPGVSGNAVAIESSNTKSARTIMTVLPVEKLQGQTITVSAKVKAANISDKPANYNGIKLMLRLVNAEGENDYPQAQIGVGTFDWKDVSLTRTIPENIVSAQLVLGLELVSGKVWFDDVQVRDAAAAPTQTPVPVPATASAAEGRSATGRTRLRGFTVDRMTPETLHKATEKWHANSVRYMMRPSYRARSLYHTDVQTAWKRMVDELPAQLDLAKELKLTVVLCLFEVPNPRSSDYPKGKERLTAFWNDETNLEGLIGCWRQIAEICADREQDIWFEILNEPLDWKDFPAPPASWPRWAQTTIDAIREIDRRHPVVIEAGPGGLCWAFKDFTPLKGEPIVYATHNYQPHVYTHQGIGEISATDLQKAYLETNLGWPGTYSDNGGGLWDKERLRKELQPLIDFQRRHNVRVYISEFSVVKWAPDAAQYLRDSLELYESLGWDWSYHALDENPLWSLEHGDAFEEPGKAKPATTPSRRADVLREYLDRTLDLTPDGLATGL
jgi:hypothetical protein